jgi:hypothetical protein
MDEDWNVFLAGWYQLICCKTRSNFETSWNTFQAKYNTTHAMTISYINETWIMPHGSSFLIYESSKYLHFGTTSTSRCEGSHAVLKSFIQVEFDNVGLNRESFKCS